MQVDINCDMGEDIGNDEAIMPFITSANIACGYHAGDKETMRSTMLLAKRHGVQVGAHPSFPDRVNFGRTEMAVTPQELYHFVMLQLHTFQEIADECRVKVHHVKPHGALYNMAARDKDMAATFVQAVKDFNGHLVVYGNNHLISEAKELKLPTKHEVFADRTYQDDGSLTPRSQPHALIEEVEKVVQHVLQMVQNKKIITLSGKEIPVAAETVCLHGDGIHAVQFAKAIHHALQKTTQRP
jgi:5-oxoprolinase (ATP-hydrolysing) subunit A